MNGIAPGWYRDPAEPTTQRYWDGEGWIGDPLPADATPPSAPPPSGPPPSAPPPSGPPPTPPSPAETPNPERRPGAPTNQPAAGSRDALPTEPGAATPEPAQQSPYADARQSAAPASGGPWVPPPGTPGPPPPGTPGPPPPSTPWPPNWPPQPGTPWPPPGYPIHPAYAQLFAPAPRPHGYPLADIGRRLVARLVDIAILVVINAVVNGWFIVRLYQEVWPWYRDVLKRAEAHLPYDDIPRPQNTQSLMFTITLIAAALWFAYEVPAVANRGQTLGKRLLGIKVLRLEADGPVGFGRALRRWNPMGIATLLWTCGVGFVLQFVDCLFVAFDRPLHQALHDKSAATVVVDVKHDRTGEPT